MPKKKKVKKVKKRKKGKIIKNTKIKNNLKPLTKALDKKSTIPGAEEKPEIKKIKKQSTEKRILTKPKIKRTMWSRRAQEYDQKINSGKIYELAEVVKDLNKNTDIIADQSYSERQLFEKAYERLKSEFEAVLNTSPEEVQKKMDKALGRTQILETAE